LKIALPGRCERVIISTSRADRHQGKVSAMHATIYHNPQCGTSRNTLAILRHAGIEPTVIEYLKTPPDRATLLRLLVDASVTPRQAVREKGTPFEELGLDDPSVNDEAIIEAMLRHPILIQRPFVVTERGRIVLVAHLRKTRRAERAPKQ